MTTIDKIYLTFKDNRSDKVYYASIIEDAGLYTVDFSYGRRGAVLTRGTKTSTPVTLDKARAIYGKLVSEKTSKGYQVNGVSGSSSTFTCTLTVKADTGFKPQLLNEIDMDDVGDYINDPEWCAQEKMDGVRRGLIKDGNTVIGTNRKGQAVDISDEIKNAVLAIKVGAEFILDGEAVGDKVYIFDCPMLNEPYYKRIGLVNSMNLDPNFLVVVPVAYTTEEKADLFNKVKAENGEGIVFKKIMSEYVSGRPNSGGDQLKAKFVAQATCVVTAVSSVKRSISLGVYEGVNLVDVGNATVYPNQTIPSVGALVEVQYLYYFPGGSLFQPVLLGERDDLNIEDCVLSQLKLKKETI
jgi:bifunctional non-homologous end joining protein LigD